MLLTPIFPIKKDESWGTMRHTSIVHGCIHHSRNGDSGHWFPMPHLNRRIDLKGGDTASAPRGPKPSRLITCPVDTFMWMFSTSIREAISWGGEGGGEGWFTDGRPMPKKEGSKLLNSCVSKLKASTPNTSTQGDNHFYSCNQSLQR
jgi:hypothetical protein